VPELDADLGLAVDPDADRLALVDDQGRFVLEELTQVLVADFLWQHREGPFVTNLSSSRAIDDVAARYDQPVYRSAVGEINVVQRMHEVDAVLGGEGNGGVILPDLHYGRDALAGTALVLQHLADTDTSLSALHDALPHYAMAKEKLPLPDLALDRLFEKLAARYADNELMIRGFTSGPPTPNRSSASIPRRLPSQRPSPSPSGSRTNCLPSPSARRRADRPNTASPM